MSDNVEAWVPTPDEMKETPPYKLTAERYASLLKAVGLTYEDVVDVDKDTSEFPKLVVLMIQGPALVPYTSNDRWALVLPPGSGGPTEEMWNQVLELMQHE